MTVNYDEGSVVIASRTVHARSVLSGDRSSNSYSLPVIKGEVLTVIKTLENSCLLVESKYQIQGIVHIRNVQLAHNYSFEDFYLSDFTAKMAETYLQDKEYGSFIVRPNSRDPDKVVISAMFNSVIHYSFYRHKDGVEYAGITYQSIPSFVNKCSIDSVLEGKLRYWIKQSDLSLPSVATECLMTMQTLNMRIVAGNRSIAVDNITSNHSLCLSVEKGKQYTIIRACRDPQMYIARDEKENEGYVPAFVLECYIPDWFHGRIDRDEAEQILNKTCRDGTFIVRERPRKRGMFALSVWCPNEVVHVPLDYMNGSIVTGNNPELPRFECLLDLVDHYSRETVFWTVNKECVRILFPLSRKETSLPEEIQKMDLKSIEMYFKALKEGREHVRDIRLMVIGHHGAGKTTLTERLMGKPFTQVGSTNGIEIKVRTCQFNVSTGIWSKSRPGSLYLDDDEAHAQRLMRLLESPVEERTSVLEELKKLAENSSKRSSLDHMPHDSSTDSLSNLENIPLDKEKDSPDSGEKETSPMNGNNFDMSYEIDDTDMNDVARYKFSQGTLRAISETFGNRARHNSKTERIGFITMWDFAGQYIFYATHQVFLSARAVYLLVLDLSKNLDDFVEDEEFPLECVDMQGRLVKDYGDFWLRSIHTFCGDIPGQPPVILVGTHKEQMKCEAEERDKMADQYFEKFRKMMEHSPVACHIQPEQFAINNTLSDCEFDRLKLAIVDVAKRQRHWYQEVPARWLPLERSLGKMRGEKTIVSLADVMEADKDNEVSIADEEEIILFLRYHHAVGNLIYFEDDELAGSVVLDPQWIIDSFKSLITASRFCRLHSHLRPLWQELQEKAALKDELIKEIWKVEKNGAFLKDKDKLLLYMEKMDIISRPNITQEDESIMEVDFYFVPSLLRLKSSTNSLLPVLSAKQCTPFLCFEFEDGFIPPAIFQRMLGACLSRYKVLSFAGTVQLFCDLGVFKLDPQHCFILRIRGQLMELQVVNMVEEEVKSSLCDKLRRFMTYLLEEELGRYHQNVPFSICIECLEGNKTSQSLIKCKELLKEGKLPCLAHDKPHTVQAEQLLSTWYPDYIEISQGQTTLEQSWISRLPEVVKNREVTEKDLSKISQCLGCNWEFVPLELGLSQVEIDQSKMDYNSQTAMQIYHCLLKWKLRAASAATILSLTKAIDSAMSVVVNWEMVKNVIDCVYHDQ